MVVTAGEGVVQAVPDRAWISVTAESRAANPRDAQGKNADAIKPVQDRLRAAGIPGDAIRTPSMTYNPTGTIRTTAASCAVTQRATRSISALMPSIGSASCSRWW